MKKKMVFKNLHIPALCSWRADKEPEANVQVQSGRIIKSHHV